jgi:hypothetical protein
MPRGEHLGTGGQQSHEIEGREHKKRDRDGERQDRWHSYRNGHTDARLGGIAHRRAGLRPGGPARRLACDQPGGNVSRDHGQFGIGPRRERLTCPEVELVFGQPVFHERGLEGLDRLLAVSLGRAELAAARGRCCCLVSRPCHYVPPHQRAAGKRNVITLRRPSPRRLDRVAGGLGGVGREDGFVPLRRCACDRDRPTGAVRPGRPLAGAGMPDRPGQVLAPAVAAGQNACPASR